MINWYKKKRLRWCPPVKQPRGINLGLTLDRWLNTKQTQSKTRPRTLRLLWSSTCSSSRFWTAQVATCSATWPTNMWRCLRLQRKPRIDIGCKSGLDMSRPDSMKQHSTTQTCRNKWISPFESSFIHLHTGKEPRGQTGDQWFQTLQFVRPGFSSCWLHRWPMPAPSRPAVGASRPESSGWSAHFTWMVYPSYPLVI